LSSDYQLEDTVFLPFTTRAFATGIPTVLAGTPAIDIYEDAGTTPVITGETLVVSLNSVVGFNMITTTATAATGFEAGKSYTAIIQAGTVGGVSVVGEVVAHFTLDMSAAAKDLANGTDGLGAIKSDTANATKVLAGDTAQGGTATTIQLAASETFADDILNGCSVKITSGTGAGQARVIIDYANSTDTATIAPSWTTNPSSDSVYEVVDGSVNLSVFNLGEVTGSLETAADIWDEVLTGATHNIADSAGRRLRDLQEFGVYEGGAVWIDTVNGSAGTTDFESGTAFNPVDTIADANTLAASLGLSRFQVASGSTITFAATQTNQVFTGDNWTLALGGQSIIGTTIIGGDVSGVASGVGTKQIFKDCILSAMSHVKNTHMLNCGLNGTQTIVEAGDFFFDQCHSAMANTDTVTFDFGAALNFSNLNVRHHSGGWNIENMGAGTGTYSATFEGEGQIIWTASCSATSNASIRGEWRITDNASGAVIETLDDNQTAVDAIGTPVGADISADIAAVKADTVIPEKNAAFSNIYVLMVDDTDHVTPKTGLTLTVQRSLDGAAFGAATGTAAEISNGMYQFDATAADMNGDTITFRFSGTSADDTFLTIVTR